MRHADGHVIPSGDETACTAPGSRLDDEARFDLVVVRGLRALADFNLNRFTLSRYLPNRQVDDLDAQSLRDILEARGFSGQRRALSRNRWQIRKSIATFRNPFRFDSVQCA